MGMVFLINASPQRYYGENRRLCGTKNTCFKKKIPSFHYMVAVAGGEDIKCAKYATFGTKELAENIIQVMRNRNACLISNHGQLTIGEYIESAVHLSIALDNI